MTEPELSPKAIANQRQIIEALGFDPINHHNAAKCPYCSPEVEVEQPTTEVGRWFLNWISELVRGTYQADDLLYTRQRIIQIEKIAAHKAVQEERARVSAAIASGEILYWHGMEAARAALGFPESIDDVAKRLETPS